MPITNSSEVAHVCSSFTNFLDLQCTLQNNLSGTPTIFIGVMAFAFLLMSAWLRLPMLAVGMGFILLGAILSPINITLFVVGILIGLIMLGLQLAKAISR